MLAPGTWDPCTEKGRVCLGLFRSTVLTWEPASESRKREGTYLLFSHPISNLEVTHPVIWKTNSV